jgi:YidC/Oxa1 family membrane protein insertase
MSDNRNFILTIVLSMLVLLGWNFYFGVPQVEKARQATPQSTSQQGTNPTPAATPQPIAIRPRDQVIGTSQRLEIETPRLKGTLNLATGRIDDISLKNYRETIEPHSKNIQFLNPEGTKDALFADVGYVLNGLFAFDKPFTASGKLTPTSPLVLTNDNGRGLHLTRTLSIDENYLFTFKDKVENKSDAPLGLMPFATISRHGTPKTEGVYVLHEGLIGVLGEKGLQEIAYDKIEKEKLMSFKSQGGWFGITDKYWAIALVPEQKMNIETKFSSTMQGAMKKYETGYLGEVKALAPNTSFEQTTSLFVGAKEVKTIQAYNEQGNIPRFDLMIDWGWFHFITKPMFWLIDYFHSLTHNFGIAILLVTLIIKGLFFPLAQKSYASIVKMKKVQPQMEALKVTYKDDRMKQQQELMALYKKESINPMAGCWPVLLQIPVFFALYKVLFVTIEMRHAPFFGWIKDLSAGDPTTIFNLFGLLPFDPGSLPVIGSFLVLGVWPLLMGITMWIQMQMNPAPNDPVQATMFRWMPVIFTFMLGSFPAGLVIYWAWSNLLSILQQGLIMKKYGVKIELMSNLKAMFGK